MDNEKCKFHICGRYCKILIGMDCDGTNENCSFYKTEIQFCKDADRAILLNREKGNCERCAYKSKPCEPRGRNCTSEELVVVSKCIDIN